MCSGLGDPNRNLNQISTKNKENNSPKKEDLIFKMDEENKRNSISSWFPSSRDISHITKYHVRIIKLFLVTDIKLKILA